MRVFFITIHKTSNSPEESDKSDSDWGYTFSRKYTYQCLIHIGFHEEADTENEVRDLADAVLDLMEDDSFKREMDRVCGVNVWPASVLDYMPAKMPDGTFCSQAECQLVFEQHYQ